jgi:uncharacterized membrane protein
VLLRIGLILKALDAVLEVVGGMLLFHPNSLNRWLVFLTQHELVRRHAKPHTVALIQNHARHAIYGASIAGAIYLIVHGLLKLTFIGGVFGKRKWGYVGLIAVLSIFTAFEFLRAAIGHGIAIFSFGVFDATLAYLVWREYQKHSAEHPANPIGQDELGAVVQSDS